MTEQEILERLAVLEETMEGLRQLSQTVAALKDLLETSQYRGPVGPDSDIEKCSAHLCDYFTHYLAQGPAELTHEGYHAACTRFMAAHNRVDQHEKECQQCQAHTGCATWDRMVQSTLPLEKRIRA